LKVAHVNSFYMLSKIVKIVCYYNYCASGHYPPSCFYLKYHPLLYLNASLQRFEIKYIQLDPIDRASRMIYNVQKHNNCNAVFWIDKLHICHFNTKTEI
jgi:hypothetical protein